MSSITLCLPDVNPTPGRRPSTCPYCGSKILQGWGRYRKRVRDQFLTEIVTRCYRCLRCQRTFRHYPAGVSRAEQTARLRKLAALMWAFGLSYRQVEVVMAAFGVPLGRSSVCRDVQALGEVVRRRRRRRPVKALGVDGAWLRAMGEKRGVVVAVDLGRGEPVALTWSIDRTWYATLEPASGTAVGATPGWQAMSNRAASTSAMNVAPVILFDI